MQIYERIRNLREDHDLTQAQVGAAINVPQRTYSYYETGQRMIPPHILCALADFYHVSGITCWTVRTNTEKTSRNFHIHPM